MLGLNNTARTIGASLLLAACSSDPAPEEPAGSSGAERPSSSSSDGGSSSDADTGSESTGGPSTSTGADPDDTAAFFEAIAGLWVAPVTSWTSVGSFPTMNMDVRAASDGVLFSRVDLDADNSLRFAFALEEHEDGTELVFRNGGEFLGILRDNRTTLQGRDGDTWQFCAMAGGCAYIDARFAFDGDDGLRLDVDVLGMRHIEWIATRRESRPLDGAFPSPPVQPGDAPFPPMPTLEVETQWSTPLRAPADVWVMLSTTDCGVNPVANCVPSRYMRAEAPVGSTGITLTLEQVHAGTYRTNAIIDRNQNVTGGVLLPDAGDAVSLPLDTPTTVPASGTGTVTLGLWTDV